MASIFSLVAALLSNFECAHLSVRFTFTVSNVTFDCLLSSWEEKYFLVNGGHNSGKWLPWGFYKWISSRELYNAIPQNYVAIHLA